MPIHDSQLPSGPGGDHPLPPAPEHSLLRKTWLVLKVLQARLRFVAILVAIGLVIGYWSELRAWYDKLMRPGPEQPVASSDVEYYCPMHPQVVRDKPGVQCPICHMSLSRRKKVKQEPLPPGIVSRVQLSPYRVALAGVQTSVIGYQPLNKEIETLGSIEFDERKQYHVASRVKGRIDKLYVNYTGQWVLAGEPLALVYSPDLMVTMQNLIDAQRGGTAELQSANRDRLVRWGIDDEQIDLLVALQNVLDGDRAGSRPLVERGRTELDRLDRAGLFGTIQALLDGKRKRNSDQINESRKRLEEDGLASEQVDDMLETGKVITHFKVRSTVNGHVIRKYVVQGQYVDEGAPLYDLADLSTVWLEAQVYEDDLAFLRAGLKVRARLPAFPGQEIQGQIDFIHPHLDEATRTLKVRVNLVNPGHDLEPGMYSRVTLLIPGSELPLLATSLAEDASHRGAVAALTRAWAGLMGSLPPTGLEVLLGAAAVGQARLQSGQVLAVAESAVIDTGSLQIVYRESEPGLFEGVAVRLGPRCGAYYPVVSGLRAGDRVVTAGSYNIDAETRLNPAAGSIYFGGAK